MFTMNWILFFICTALICSGCQNFRYYDPAKPHRGKSQFLNNYDNSPKVGFWKWQWERLTTQRPEEPPFQPEVLKTDTAFLRANQKQITLTWVGHSTAFLQLEGLNILVDPVFSDRVSPVSFMGPKRLVPLPFQLKELPPIDVVVVSHAHYDHLDLPTLKELAKKDQGRVLFLVPLGNKEFLKSEGILNVQEFDWWEHTQHKNLKFTFVPAQHWSARGVFDQNQALWGGWHISAPAFKFIYVGDTGYSKDFQDIYAQLGAVDLAMIPVGTYEPRWFMKRQHVNPEEALMIHRDLHAKTSIGVHWGTFRLSDEPMAQPFEDFAKALKAHPVEGVFKVMKHGETVSF